MRFMAPAAVAFACPIITPMSDLRPVWASWKPSPFLRLSAALHAIAVLGWLLAPAPWPWWLALLVGNHVLIATAGLWPRSRLLGPNLTRLPPAAAARGEVALTFDDGPDPAVTPQVLALLDAAGARATFFCIGERVLRHAELAREIVRRGHQIENHTQSHPHLFAAHGWRRMAAQIDAAQRSIADVTGRAPRMFRAVAGLRNPFLDPILAQRDLQLAAWTRRGFDTRSTHADAVLARLTRGLCGGDVLLLHDGNAARTADGQPVVLAVLPRLLAHMRERDLRSVPLAESMSQAAAPRWREAAA